MNFDRTLLASLPVVFLISGFAVSDDYRLGPDSQRQEGVPRGKVTQHRWTESKVFPGTERDWWLYVPAQHDPKTPAKVMVFQDGGGYVKEDGQYRVPVVLDNLIHQKKLPPIVGVFINPGVMAGEKDAQGKPASHRSAEYDTLSDAYARFLLEEILPEAGKTVKLSDRPEDRAIGGASSGGICSWTVAWERPDAFRKVMSFIGSFTNIRGGHVVHALIRKTPPKPIRVFLQDGSADLDNAHGNWPLANQEMAAALKFAGYDYKFEYGTEGHNGKHGGAILPEALMWLWR